MGYCVAGLLGQPYGNTLTAYRWLRSTYGAGQGLHFGIDLSAPFRTEVVAVGDGLISKVDATNHDAGPHNLMINHANGYASFDGHLFERPAWKSAKPLHRDKSLP